MTPIVPMDTALSGYSGIVVVNCINGHMIHVKIPSESLDLVFTELLPHPNGSDVRPIKTAVPSVGQLRLGHSGGRWAMPKKRDDEHKTVGTGIKGVTASRHGLHLQTA